MEDPSSPTGEKIIPVLEQLRLKEEEIARLQEQMRQQQREMAELRRQLQSDEEALYRAAKSGDMFAVRRLVAANVNVDCTPRGDHWTPLMSASFNGHVEVVRILIGSQAQLNKQQKHGYTALYLATQEGKVDVVRLLTEAGAQLNIQTEVHLNIAALQGHLDTVKRLVEVGVTLTTRARMVGLLSTVPVSKATLMWWTISSGQEPVSTWPPRAKGHSDTVRLLERRNK